MKRVIIFSVLSFFILSLCSCTGTGEPESAETASAYETTDSLTSVENTTGKRTEGNKRIPIKNDFINVLSGAVDYMRYVSDNEVLFEIWEKDETDHLYIYNTQTGEMTDTQKTVNGILNCNGSHFWTVEKTAMGENFTVKQLDNNYNVISSDFFTDISVKMSRYAISDSGTKVIVSDGYKTENDIVTVKITNLKTKEEKEVKYKRDDKYKADNVCALTDDKFIFQCEYTDGEKKMRAFCLSDFDGNIINTYNSERERVFKNDYHDFILIYNQSEIIPSIYGDCVLMDKTTGKTKAVKFSKEIGEGQDVTASLDGKYVMTKCTINAGDEVVHRIYSVETGEICCSFALDYAQFGSNYIFIDDVNDAVYVFRYDIESNKKDIKLYEIGESND